MANRVFEVSVKVDGVPMFRKKCGSYAEARMEFDLLELKVR